MQLPVNPSKSLTTTLTLDNNFKTSTDHFNKIVQMDNTNELQVLLQISVYANKTLRAFHDVQCREFLFTPSDKNKMVFIKNNK